MRGISVVRRVLRGLVAFLGNHYLGAAAAAAFALAVYLWIWIAQDAPVAINIFNGWRQAAIVGCAGIVFGGLAAECVALAGRSAPGETPVCSAVIAGIFAMPLYAGCILLSLAG